MNSHIVFNYKIIIIDEKNITLAYYMSILTNHLYVPIIYYTTYYSCYYIAIHKTNLLIVIISKHY